MKRGTDVQRLPASPLGLAARLLPFLPLPALLVGMLAQTELTRESLWTFALAFVPMVLIGLLVVFLLAVVQYRLEGDELVVDQKLFQKRIARTTVTGLSLQRMPFSQAALVKVEYRKGPLHLQTFLRLQKPEQGLGVLQAWRHDAAAAGGRQ